jgi:hypothetical protein
MMALDAKLHMGLGQLAEQWLARGRLRRPVKMALFEVLF